MSTEKEKILILQAFCDRFGVTKIEGKRILEQSGYDAFIAEKTMTTRKTKTDDDEVARGLKILASGKYSDVYDFPPELAPDASKIFEWRRRKERRRKSKLTKKQRMQEEVKSWKR